jgi:protein JSN1
MPQRTNYVGSAGPFGPTLFSSNWSNGRERNTTLSSINSTNGPSSPAHSSFSKDGMGDNEMRTLDYLGLADTPQPARAALASKPMETVMEGQRAATLQPFIADMALINKNLNRFRSYSVNAKEKYAEEEDEELEHGTLYTTQHSGSVTPSAASAAAALAATQAQIHQHNLAVQAFANHASASRPRARTAGVLESPPQRSMRSYLATPSRLDNSITAADLRIAEAREYEGLPEAVQALQLGIMSSRQVSDGANLAGDENNLEGPTRALWLGSIPASTTITSLIAIFQPYGAIESARVLTHKNCGFVNFERLESAIQARSFFNGKEIFPGAGPVRIGYAKAPTTPAAGQSPGHNGVFPSPSPDPYSNGQPDSGISASSTSNRDGVNGSAQPNGPQAENAAAALIVPGLQEIKTEMVRIVRDFGAADEDQKRISKSIDEAIKFDNFASEIPTVPEPSHNRVHDAPKLRDIRKRIDNNSCSQAEIEDIANGMLDEIAELSSDYLGNTVVQKLFEYCAEDVKESMLREIAPHMAEIGIHKNGTWAAQKIIDVAKTSAQMSMIVENLRPYTVALFLDQYGNYVLQCCLRFGSPWNDFIFETMLSRMWEIAQGRFGARAVRACLESHHATKDQQRMLAAAIALHSVQLATNANGALLLTWFLDTCTFPRRRTVLAPRLVPHLVHLCTHKVAYLTVLKVINQRNEPEARDTILKALFFSPGDKVLEDILSDHSCGATLIFKVLTTPFFDESLRSEVIQNVRSVLLRLKAQPAQGYKRLMDEVGLSTRNGISSGPNREHHTSRESSTGQSPTHERQRTASHQTSSNGSGTQQPMERQFSGQYFPNIAQQQYDPNTGMARGPGMDSSPFQTLEQYGLGGLSTPLFATPNTSISTLNPQLQYQQALLAASAQSLPQAFYPGLGNNINGYATPPPSIESFRNPRAPPGHGSPISPPPAQMSASPMLGQNGFVPPAFRPMIGGQLVGAGYQYSPMNGLQYIPQQQGGGRRGRVSQLYSLTEDRMN